MLEKFRRSSKQFLESRRSSVATIPKADVKSTGHGKLTFFDLPAEIRNVIYENIASQASISIPPVGKKTVEPVPCMLLVSQQIKREYMPLMLEFAQVSVKIKDFDFRNLIRVSSSLYSTEQKALRNSTRLRVNLIADRCTKDSMRNLHKWLSNRSTGFDRLDWKYGIAWPKDAQMTRSITEQVQVTDLNIQRWNALNQNLKMMGLLQDSLNDNLSHELQPIISAFGRERTWIGGDPHKAWIGDGTASYGFRMRNQTSCSNWG